MIELQRFLFAFQGRGLSVQESDEQCEGQKGDVKYVLCFGLDVSGAPVLADHNSVDFCSGILKGELRVDVSFKTCFDSFTS